MSERNRSRLSFGEIVDRITKKKWSPEDVANMVGADARAAWLTYASDPSIRAEAASGGTTSALLIHALETGAIDGAIVCKTVIEDGAVRAQFVLARTREEVLAARGSKYVETKFLRDVLPILRENEGRFAVCGLPCDISNLKRWEEKEPLLAERVALRVAFLCGHNSRCELIDGVVRKLNKEAGRSDLVGFKFRTGNWRGHLSAIYADGSVLRKPFKYFSDYRNLSFYSERKCLACIDHFGYASDISIGDVWLYRLRDHPIKHSGVLVRSERAEALVKSAIGASTVVAEDVPVSMILDGQTRIGPTHYNISARAKAGRFIGVKIPDTLGIKASPLSTFSSFLGLINMRISEGPHAGKIFRVPRPLIRAYLYFKKGLESL
ncbi:Coenzyme F420 hydrogenase/dehydrogenase, beta subunit C-terminal domain [Microvirga sp. 2MCAF38]|uniref:Coenzyme F420 hydrogenase/dehydrogenase, beta subunit C-terminal domain n=1 Tax=Microvirga sp. 2MCAF38 TaxID=3232989 RepID=UPI003F962A9C